MLRAIIASASYSSLQEAQSLWRSLGGEVSRTHIFDVKRPNSKYYLGNGQLQEVQAGPEEIFYCDLPISPVNRRELEKLLKFEVWDRTEVVLRIFNQRAHTAEAKLQVKLANFIHQKRKLVGAWTHLERQKGNLSKIGGPGELQKEIDRRLLDGKIEHLKKRLLKVKNQRKTRRRTNSIAIVGYTNAGKTSFLRMATRDTIQPSPKLFATLDPRTRFWHLGEGKRVPLVDTVGFVSDIDSLLIDAFHATLEEALYASIVLHLHDVSDPEWGKKGEYVSDTLQRLGLDLDRVINVWNKCDLTNCRVGHQNDEANGFALSSVTGEGYDLLRDAVRKRLGIKDRRLFVKKPEMIPRCKECKPLPNGFLVDLVADEAEWMRLRHQLREVS